jgi:hypothetical protein
VIYEGAAFEQLASYALAGRFREAQNLLIARKAELQRANGLAYNVFQMELALESGDLISSRRVSERLLGETTVPEVRAVSHRVLAEVNASQLMFEESLENYRAAREVSRAEVSPLVAATIELSFLKWFLGVLPLESTESQFAGVRRAVARSAHPLCFAELRLCVARLEARRGAIVEAARHLAPASCPRP